MTAGISHDPKLADFRWLIGTRFLFALGYQIQALVMGWQVYQIKHDPLYLGLIGLAEALPAITLAFISGTIVDRSNPFTVYKNVLRLSLLSSLILGVVSSTQMNMSGASRVPWIYLAALTTGVARGFAGPAHHTIIPRLVPREILAVSSAWITSAFQIATVSGPALGGLFYAWQGPFLAYTVVSALLVTALGLFSRIRHPFTKPIQPSRAIGFEELTSGIRFVFGRQLLVSVLALDMFAVLFGGATAILPIFAAEVLHIGPKGLGLLRASPAMGALLMSAFLIRRPAGRAAGKVLLIVITGYGLCMIGFALSTVFWLSALMLALSGALDSISMVLRTAIVQLSSPDAMRGRIAAVNSIFILSSNEIGAFESGVAAKLLGTVPSVVFGGTMTLLTVGITALLAPKLRRMELKDLG